MPRHGRRALGVVVAVVLVVGVAVVWQPWAAKERSFREPSSVEDLVGRIQRSVPSAMREGHVPGAAVAIVHDGRVVWAQGFGVSTRGGARVTPRTRFQVGSLSKPVTAWGAVASASQRILPLDEPLTRVLRPWPLPQSTLPADGITPARLLSHTAGLSVEGYLGTAPPRPVGSTLQSIQGRGGEGRATAVRLVDRPGARYRYSGGGYTLLQAAIEQRTRLPFATWAKRAVLDPLQMTDSAFAPLPTPGHDARGHPTPAYRYAELAAAGLTSTADDMGRFAMALLRDPDRLATPQPGTDGSYGFGVHVDHLAGGVRRISHEGVNRGWHARLLAYPERRWAAVVLTNGDGGAAVADALQHALER